MIADMIGFVYHFLFEADFFAESGRCYRLCLTAACATIAVRRKCEVDELKRGTYRKIRSRMAHLSPAAARVLRIGMTVWGGLMACALLLLLCGRPFSLETYPLFVRAGQLHRAAFAVYFCTAFLTCFVEEQTLK